jgi:hemoglobin
LGMIENIADAFINDISINNPSYSFIEGNSAERFREEFINHICIASNGPCEYTSNSIQGIPVYMEINEAVFHHNVEVLINAMSTVGVDHRLQNQLLKRLAPMRKDIIYVAR